ncbi:ATP-dependent DNA ligase [Geobacillus virus E3]|uniref:ATP-dependent DNA ligase n=1 Tax=Geobacillus virus E3 TaxID=1572712 RepID=UPI0006719A80|nr:ATP-dependent DNA ligase [Geobacillus virus E3]AJA41424.1 putative ATP-dependent DNA ligase [Geobacillus virus E3]
MYMKDVLHIINQIKETSSRNEKEVILKQHKDNQTLRKVLDAALNPYVVFGIGEKKLKKFINKVTGKENKFNDLFEVIEYLKVHNTGTDHDVKMVAEFLNSQDVEELKEFYKEIITKTLKIGVTAKSINKAFGEKFIPEFNVMLAKKFEDEEHKVKGKEFVITEKLDGMRTIMIVENGNVTFFSRQGQPITGLVEIIRDAVFLPDNVYDGELLIANADDYKDREVLQETLKIARKDGEKRGLVLHLFDMIPIEEFKAGKSKATYRKRKEELSFIVEKLDSPYIKVVPNLYVGKDLDVIPKLLEEMNRKGKEGLMLNLSDGKYQCKRTDVLLKIKSMNTMDCRIIGFEEGTGKYEGVLGALIVDYKGYELRCGSGFTDEDRKEIWDNKEKYLGKIAEIQYFRESRNQDGGLSVSFPVFICIRDDKNEPSYF